MRYAWLALLLALSGCGLFRHTAVTPHPAYTLGGAYQAGNTWFYPHEAFEYDVTGLADVPPAHTGLTADGEAVDRTAMTASHQTLQLPCIARVTNLETGRSALVRINDRGPADRGRLIALSPRAAEVLAVRPGTRVRVQVDEGMSRQLAASLQGDPALAIATAPRGAIRSEELPPPPGAAQSSRVRRVAAAAAPVASDATPGVDVPVRLPETVSQGMPAPGTLFVRASEFGRMEYAQQLRARLAGLPVEIERVHEPRQDRYRVRAGPFATVADVDAALAQAVRAGVADARIVVE